MLSLREGLRYTIAMVSHAGQTQCMGFLASLSGMRDYQIPAESRPVKTRLGMRLGRSTAESSGQPCSAGWGAETSRAPLRPVVLPLRLPLRPWCTGCGAWW